MIQHYRRTGADVPWGDPRRPHGVAMEGSYWRLTDVASGRVVVALRGACLGPRGPWQMVALAVHPEGVVHWATGDGLMSDGETALRVAVGDSRLDVTFDCIQGWPARRPFGALGPAHAIPGLPQYWHPHALGGTATGTLELAGRTIDLHARLYAEKNWGSAFSHHWWWGQAHDFPAADACVAFAGGRALGAAPTAAVVRLEERVLRFGPPFARMTAAVGTAGWRIRARGPLHAVEIEGDAAGRSPFTLPVPMPAEHAVVERSQQWPNGGLTVTLRRGRRTLLRQTSPLAGLERAIDLG